MIIIKILRHRCEVTQVAVVKIVVHAQGAGYGVGRPGASTGRWQKQNVVYSMHTVPLS